MAVEKKKVQTFLDGVCDIWRQEDTGQFVRIRSAVRYANRIIGSKRSFEAMQAGHTIQKVIRVPLYGMPFNGCRISIGTQQYEILQAQGLDDTSPRCAQLTLEQPDILWALNDAGGVADGCT